MDACHQGDTPYHHHLPTEAANPVHNSGYLFLHPRGQTPFCLVRSLELTEELGVDRGLTAQMGVALGHVPSA